ncbi:serine protease [Acholeplasma granularum]|uniref:serine protease n=1 Tax=Acholeplasma granularum TaxID=264635 RepID=UPI000472DBBE|nr:serine protease [Acholeplasma granularum]
MKKVKHLFILVIGLLLLTSCVAVDEYIEQYKPIAYAPELTLEEVSFIDLIQEKKKSGISINNLYATDTGNKTRRGSGVIVKKEEGTLIHRYYALTTQWVVENTITLTVNISPTENVVAVVLNPKLNYDKDEDIALISFTSNKNLTPITLEPLIEDTNLDSLEIFSIATPISNGYFNYPTNPAIIMGVFDNRIVHGTNLNIGTLGSPLYLKETGQLIGINVSYSTVAGGRPEVLINEAIHINQVIELVKGYL